MVASGCGLGGRLSFGLIGGPLTSVPAPPGLGFGLVSVQDGIVAAQPLEHHAGVLFLFVAIVREDALELVVCARQHALVVPVDRLQLFHQ